jgi:hypothetical protein
LISEDIDFEETTIYEPRRDSKVGVIFGGLLALLLILGIALALLSVSKSDTHTRVVKTHPVKIVKVVKVVEAAPKGLYWVGRFDQTENELAFISEWKNAAAYAGNWTWYRKLEARERHFEAQVKWDHARYEAVIHGHRK